MSSEKSEEYLDVVDENDVPTGEVIARSLAHESPIPHRIATVYVFDKSGHLYVQVHKKSGGLFDHSVGGHVDAGETYLEAAIREMQEEVGLETPLELVAESVYEDCREVGRGNIVHFHGVFKTTTPDDWVVIPNDKVEELHLREVEDIAKDMEANASKYTYGFIKSMGAYLRSVESGER